MTEEETLKLECLRLAVEAGECLDVIKRAKLFYAFVTKKDGDNVVAAAHVFSKPR